MHNGGFNYNSATNFRPSHQQIDRVPFQDPPIYTSFELEPRHRPQFHQSPRPPVNPPLPPPPSGYGGYSDYEQRLRNEVIYLHCLWHRGPPQRQIQNPHLLKPLPTTLFKNKKKKSNKPQVVSDKEWPIDPKAACPSSAKQGWGEFKASTSPKTFPVTSQEKDRVSAVRVQLKGLDSFLGFFQKSDDDDLEEEEEEDYDKEEVFEFFFNVFEEDENLRGYYKTKCESGEFYCLVCGVIANKLGRKYKDCVALVQHSVSISKTKRRIAHRAYARVVCKVLGWDIDRLPSLPSTIVETQSLEISSKSEPPLPQGEVQNNVDGSEEKPTVVEKEGGPATRKKSSRTRNSF